MSLKKESVLDLVQVATFSSALMHVRTSYPVLEKPGLVLKDKQLEALKCLYRWEIRVSVGTDRLWQVHISAFRLSLS